MQIGNRLALVTSRVFHHVTMVHCRVVPVDRLILQPKVIYDL